MSACVRSHAYVGMSKFVCGRVGCSRIAMVGWPCLAPQRGAMAQACGNTGAGFDAWLAGFKSRAAAAGVPAARSASGLAGVSYDPERDQPRPRTALVQAELRAVLCAARFGLADLARASLMASNAALLDRIEAALRRARRGADLDLGAGDQLRAQQRRRRNRSCARWRRWPTIAGARSSSRTS